jgi:hypothetical protein
MTFDFNALNAAIEAEANQTDMSVAQDGGGEYTPPALGLAQARFVGYYETGKHEEEYEGQKRVRDKVDMVFELSGPNHPPRVLADGTRIPLRITVKETKSQSAKANFFKLFGAMNYDGAARHMAQLLGKAYLVEVFHKESKGKIFANLKGTNGYNIKGPFFQDPLSGKTVAIDVAPPQTEIKGFLFNSATKAMWDSIYIAGEYEERKDEKTGAVISPARSKNTLQERIMKAQNWKDCPVYAILAAGGEPDLPDATTVPANEAAGTANDDPLSSMG